MTVWKFRTNIPFVSGERGLHVLISLIRFQPRMSFSLWFLGRITAEPMQHKPPSTRCCSRQNLHKHLPPNNEAASDLIHCYRCGSSTQTCLDGGWWAGDTEAGSVLRQGLTLLLHTLLQFVLRQRQTLLQNGHRLQNKNRRAMRSTPTPSHESNLTISLHLYMKT